MQLTLQLRPEEVRAADAQGVRHFGVALNDRHSFEELARRLETQQVHWLARPAEHTDADLSHKSNFRIADPSGNVIEIKFYDDQAALRPPSVG